MNYKDIRYIHDLLESDVEQKKNLFYETDDQLYRYATANFNDNRDLVAFQNDLTNKRDKAMQQLNAASSAFESFKSADWYMKG